MNTTFRNVLLGGAAVIAAISVSSVNSAGALNALPPGYSDLVPEVDFGPAMSSLVNIATTACTVKSSNVSALPVATKIDLPPADLMQFAGALGTMKSSGTSLVTLDCASNLQFDGTEKVITGTVTNAALALKGTFSLKCSFKQSFTVSASLSIGMAVKGGSQLIVSPTTTPIPISCGIRIEMSDGTTVTAAVEGSAGGGETAPCEGATDRTCVGIVADTKVIVTSATGALKGYVGSGTYSFQDSFTLPSINENLGQVGSLLGKSSVRAYRSVPQAMGNAGVMKIAFVPGAAKTEILYPAVVAGTKTIFGKNATYGAVSAPGAKCTFTAVSGKRQFVLPSVTANAQGATATKTLTSAQATAMAKSLRLKEGSAIVLRAKCGKATTNQNVVYGAS
jgi:hypothetical protein